MLYVVEEVSVLTPLLAGWGDTPVNNANIANISLLAFPTLLLENLFCHPIDRLMAHPGTL
jgi:hypothetical protein